MAEDKGDGAYMVNTMAKGRIGRAGLHAAITNLLTTYCVYVYIVRCVVHTYVHTYARALLRGEGMGGVVRVLGLEIWVYTQVDDADASMYVHM